MSSPTIGDPAPRVVERKGARAPPEGACAGERVTVKSPEVQTCWLMKMDDTEKEEVDEEEVEEEEEEVRLKGGVSK